MFYLHWISQPSGKSVLAKVPNLGNQDISYLMMKIDIDRGHENKHITEIVNFHFCNMNV